MLTTLPPAPPTPITLMTARLFDWDSNSSRSGITSLSRSIAVFDAEALDRRAGDLRPAAFFFFLVCVPVPRVRWVDGLLLRFGISHPPWLDSSPLRFHSTGSLH